jgi:leucyl-tRNA synthetase
LPDSVGYENDLGAFTLAVDRASHKTIKKIHDDLHDMRFNTAVSTLMEYVNFLSGAGNRRRLLQENALLLKGRTIRTLVLLLAPMTPHLAEELWHELGEDGSVHVAAWPKYDPSLIKDDFLTIVVQVAGRVRANLVMPASATDEELSAAALADPKVAKFLVGHTIAKTIVVPRKLVNFVVK